MYTTSSIFFCISLSLLPIPHRAQRSIRVLDTRAFSYLQLATSFGCRYGILLPFRGMQRKNSRMRVLEARFHLRFSEPPWTFQPTQDGLKM